MQEDSCEGVEERRGRRFDQSSGCEVEYGVGIRGCDTVGRL